ncbi:MAG: multidrug DMT transporter permease [Planctomycetes bacterium SCN 63-9]|nr:MAG: multidrug DMT transporter permease [Planctomycetes bacterium SCN 63-9]
MEYEGPNADRSGAIARGGWYVFAAGVLWSLSGVMTKSLPLDSLTIAFYRGLFAGLALIPWVRPRSWTFRPSMIWLGLCFGAMTGLYLGAVKSTTAANAIYLQYTATFWVIPLGAIFLKETPDRRSLVAIIIAMIGICVIVVWGYDGRPHEWRGIALGLASGLAYAIVATGMRGLRDLDPIWLSTILNLGGSITLGCAIVLNAGAAPMISTGSQILILIAFGVVQMAIPYVLFARGLRHIGAAEASLIALIEPILNPIWVIFVNHEWPAMPTLVGGVLLLSGVTYKYWPRHEFRENIR